VASNLNRIAAAALVAFVGLSVPPLGAHHSFASEFDFWKPVALTGTIVRVEWANPHAWLDVAVNDATRTLRWTVEMSPPSALWRRGLRPDTLVPGTAVVIRGYAAKNGTHKARGRALTLSDGRRISLGPADVDESR
jgi:hypothetical protein